VSGIERRERTLTGPVPRELAIRNRQRVRALRIPLLRQITRHLLAGELQVTGYELALHLVDAPEMARINEQFLQHEGSTDVITFDLRELQPETNLPAMLCGEVFISIPDAVQQAREFNTTWPAEVMRYVIHGLLHLSGYDDLEPAKRRIMKREENRLLKRIAAEFPIDRLAQTASRRFPR
jgi:probable rRNA maturation factor